MHSSPKPWLLAGLLPLALLVAACGAGATSSAPSAQAAPARATGTRSDEPLEQAPRALPPRDRTRAATGPASPFDTTDPRVGKLDPDLLGAVQDAARAAQADGVRLRITSGWRSRTEQQRLLAEAVQKYGSTQAALRWVASPGTSAHVTGDAVDVGPTAADDWLSQHGSAYGLCQTFANEIWHYELATAPGGTCPEQLPDGSYR